MIEYLFPTAIYKGKNESFLDLANELFDGRFISTNPKFKTTLAGYYPGKAAVAWDPLVLPKVEPLVDFIKESVGNYLKELKSVPLELYDSSRAFDLHHVDIALHQYF